MRKILVIGTFPPPTFGSAAMLEGITEIKHKDLVIEKFDTSFNDDFSDLEKFRFSKIFLLIKYIIKYFNKLTTSKFDLIIITPSMRSSALFKDSLFILAAIIFKIKVVLYIQAQGFDNFYKSRTRLFRAYISFLYRRCFYLVAVGESIISEYENWFEKDRCYYIHNYLIETELLNVPLNYSSQTKNILFLSTLKIEKGLFVLYEALKILKQKGIDFVVHFAGYMGSTQEDIDFFEKMKSEFSINYHGFVEGEKKNELFHLVDVFVFPSLNDSFGIVNLEAMAAGLPVIASKIGAIPEYITNEENGFLIEPGDSNTLAEKLKYLFENEKVIFNMGTTNRKKVTAQFTKEVFDSKWCEILLTKLS